MLIFIVRHKCHYDTHNTYYCKYRRPSKTQIKERFVAISNHQKYTNQK